MKRFRSFNRKSAVSLEKYLLQRELHPSLMSDFCLM